LCDYTQMIRKETDFDLSAWNTFGMKVSCRCFVEYDTEAELRELDLSSLPQPVLHIGGGSNLLFTGNFPGTVLHSKINFVKFVDMGLDDVYMAVGAGVKFDDFCEKACEAGYWGAENLSLIPGEVGAAAVQNIGAYGAEVSEIISGVVCYDTVNKSKTVFKAPECGYGYRESRFKSTDKGRYIVTSVLFHLTRKYSPKLDYKGVKEALGSKTPKTPLEMRQIIIDIRNLKLPDPARIGSAGSFFKNPTVDEATFLSIAAKARAEGIEDIPHFDIPGRKVKIPAAWLIDKSGLKEASKGGAALFENQPLVLVNRSGEATPQDIINLETQIVETVFNKFGVLLQPEVEHIQ